MPEGRLGEAKVPDADLELVEGRLGKANMPGADPELVTRGGSSSGGGGSNGSTTSAGGVGSSSSTATSTAGSLDPRARLVRASLCSWAPATPGDPSSNRMQTAGETIGRKQAAAPPPAGGNRTSAACPATSAAALQICAAAVGAPAAAEAAAAPATGASGSGSNSRRGHSCALPSGGHGSPPLILYPLPTPGLWQQLAADHWATSRGGGQ